jgi:hypothetical protein
MSIHDKAKECIQKKDVTIKFAMSSRVYLGCLAASDVMFGQRLSMLPSGIAQIHLVA